MIWFWLWAVAAIVFAARTRETSPPEHATLRIGFTDPPRWGRGATPLAALSGLVVYTICARTFGLALTTGWHPAHAWPKWLAALLGLAVALLVGRLARPDVTAAIAVTPDHLVLPVHGHAIRSDRVPWQHGPVAEGDGPWLVVHANSRRYRYLARRLDHPDPAGALGRAIASRVEDDPELRDAWARRRALATRAASPPWGTALLLVLAVTVGAAAVPARPELQSPLAHLGQASAPYLVAVAAIVSLVLGRRLERLTGGATAIGVGVAGLLGGALSAARLAETPGLAPPGPLAIPASLLGALLYATLRFGPGLPGRDRLTMRELLTALLTVPFLAVTELTGTIAALPALVAGVVVAMVAVALGAMHRTP